MDALGGRFSAAQWQGARDYQEDDFGFLELSHVSADACDQAILVLADGMGGHVGGDRASSMAVKAMLEDFEQGEGGGAISERLLHAAHAANDQLAKSIRENPGLDGMGTTLVGAALNDEGLYWLSIGDSPMWLYRAGALYRLNEDHSMAPVLADLVATGRLSEEDAKTDKRRNSLRSAVMGDELSLVDTGGALGLMEGDILLLASDGIETLSPAEIVGVLEQNLDHSLSDACAALIAAVKWKERPNQDNVTILLYRPDTAAGRASLDGITPIAIDEPETGSGGKTGIMARLLGGFLRGK